MLLKIKTNIFGGAGKRNAFKIRIGAKHDDLEADNDEVNNNIENAVIER